MLEAQAQVQKSPSGSQNYSSNVYGGQQGGNGNQMAKLTTCDHYANGYCVMKNGHKIRQSELNVSLLNGVIYDNHAMLDNDGNLLTSGKDICSSIDNNKHNSSNNPQASIRFDKNSYGIESGGTIWIKLHYLPNPQPNKPVEFICAMVTSDSDHTGIPIILEEIRPDTNSEIYKNIGIVTFTSNSSSDQNYGPQIHVSYDDKVTVTFMNATRTATILHTTAKGADSYGGSVSLSPSLYGSLITAYNCITASVDGICGEWKTGGPLTISINGATYTGPSCGGAGQDVCPSTTHNDIFLEVDSLSGYSGSASATALTDVQTSFKGATSSLPLFNGRATSVYPHVFLHYENTTSSTSINTCPMIYFPTNPLTGQCEYNSIKTGDIWTSADSCSGTDPTSMLQCKQNKKQAFHFALFAGEIGQDPSTSGAGEMYGNDMVVSLGASGFIPTSVMEQEGTLMHELGHNLNLDHGGNNSTNCKPNYFSVMNYLYQFTNFVNRPLDFSQSAVGDNAGHTWLNTRDLVEQNGLGASRGMATGSTSLPAVYATVPFSNNYMTTNAGTSSVPWDGDQIPNTPQVQINDFYDASGMIACASQGGNLTGFQDWSNSALNYQFRFAPTFKVSTGMGSSDMKAVRHANFKQISDEINGIVNVPAVLTTAFDASGDQDKDTNLKPAIHTLEALNSAVDRSNLFNNTAKSDIETKITNLIYSLKQDTNYTNIQFDQEYYDIHQTAKITVTDPDLNGNTKTITVTVAGTPQPGNQTAPSLPVTLTRQPGGTYTGTFKIGTDLTPVNWEDSIAVTYDNYFGASAQITDYTQP